MRRKLIKKLANAIRAYRGATGGITSDGVLKWKHHPQKSKLGDVQRYAADLGLDVTLVTKMVNNFVSYAEFEEWIGNLE